LNLNTVHCNQGQGIEGLIRYTVLLRKYIHVCVLNMNYAKPRLRRPDIINAKYVFVFGSGYDGQLYICTADDLQLVVKIESVKLKRIEQ
jgi:hypothetical protein